MSIDKQHIASSFSKAASHYDEHAFIQREIGDRLFERLDYMKLNPSTILDVGCGTGHYTRLLKKRFPKAKVIGIDIAEGMVELAKRQNGWFKKCHYECADMDDLPFEHDSVDLIFSNLAIQWSQDLNRTIAELSRVLSAQGLLMFSTLGPDTLIELKQSWQTVDGDRHVNDFIDMHDIGDCLMQHKFHQPVMDMEKITFTYASLKALMVDLKGIGAHNMNDNRPSTLTSKSKWRAVNQAYENYRNENGLLPSSYEVIYGHGWGTPFTKSSDNDVYQVQLS